MIRENSVQCYISGVACVMSYRRGQPDVCPLGITLHHIHLQFYGLHIIESGYFLPNLTQNHSHSATNRLACLM